MTWIAAPFPVSLILLGRYPELRLGGVVRILPPPQPQSQLARDLLIKDIVTLVERSTIMTTLRYTRSTTLRLIFRALLTVTTLLMPLGAKAVERDGTVLFFPLEDIQHVL